MKSTLVINIRIVKIIFPCGKAHQAELLPDGLCYRIDGFTQNNEPTKNNTKSGVHWTPNPISGEFHSSSLASGQVAEWLACQLFCNDVFSRVTSFWHSLIGWLRSFRIALLINMVFENAKNKKSPHMPKQHAEFIDRRYVKSILSLKVQSTIMGEPVKAPHRNTMMSDD